MSREEICDEIAKDAENDATNFDGQPFNGKTVATYFGNHGASIAALANLVKELIKENEEFKRRISQQQEKLDYLTNRINS